VVHTDESHRPVARTAGGAGLAGLRGEDVLDGGHRKLTRRAALSVLTGGVVAAVGFRQIQSPSEVSSALPTLGRRLVLSIEESEQWDKRAGLLDSSIPRPLLARALRRDDGVETEVAEWRRSSGLEFAEGQAWAAFERRLANESAIADITATDIQGLLVQAEAMTMRHEIGIFAHEHRLVHNFIRGLELIRSAYDLFSASDADVISVCRDWNMAIDEIQAAEFALNEVDTPRWAMKHLLFESDPTRRMEIEAEQRRTGFHEARERLGAAQDRLIAIEDSVASTTGTTFAALLAQARPITRRLAPTSGLNHVTARIGMALVRGLERLGGRRTCRLHDWWPDENQVPVQPTG